MPKSSLGGYVPLTIPTEVLAAAPKPVQQLWSKVTAAQIQVRDGRDLLTTLEADAANAPMMDDQAARAAIAAGKPIPEPTVVVAEHAAEQQRRAVRALADHADDAEWNFLAALNGHRSEMVDGFYKASVQALDDALAALAAAGDAVGRFTSAGALWSWARSEDGGQPSTYGYHLPQALGHDLTAVIDASTLALDKAHPDAVVQAEDDYRTAVAAARGRATADGLVLDRSGRDALYNMAAE